MSSVALIGGGVTAALSAVRLAERGFAVTVVEKAGIGNGSSSRSAAGIRAQFGVEETIVGMLYSQWWYMHFHEHLQTPLDRRQPVYRQSGYLFLYDDPDYAATVTAGASGAARAAWERAQATAARQRRLGVSVELLSPAAVGRRWPHLLVDRLIGATWCPTDGFLFPPVIYGEGLRRAAELGATVLQQAEVLAGERRDGRLVAVQTTRGRIAGDWFVNCTNAWAPRTSRRLGGLELAVSPVKRFLYFLRPERAMMSETAWSRLPMTIYGLGGGLGLHSRPDGRHLLLAGASRWTPEPDFLDEDQDHIPAEFDHRHGIDNLGLRLLQALAEYAPELAECGGLVATTSGYYGMTPDANPLIGVDGALANLVHAAGFSGHGVMHAPVTALLVEGIIADDVRNGRLPLPPPFSEHHLDLRTFDPGRDFTQSVRETAVL